MMSSREFAPALGDVALLPLSEHEVRPVGGEQQLGTLQCGALVALWSKGADEEVSW